MPSDIFTEKKSRLLTPPSDLIMRGFAISWEFFLILLPLAAVFFSGISKGFSFLWEQITLPQSLHALKLTIISAILMVLVNVVTGTATAWVLVRSKFPGKNLMNALIDLPFAIPTVVTGIMLVLLYGPNTFIGGFLEGRGITVIFGKPGILLALLFVTFPLCVRSVQPVLQELDQDMEEAAQTLGASNFLIFFRIVLPSLLPAILTGAALSFSRALGEFGAIAIVSGNIPFKTQVASVFIYGEIESGNPQAASGLSFVLLLSAFLTLLLLNYLQKFNRKKRIQ